MNKVTLFDNNFSHAFSRNNGDLKILSKHIIFDRKEIHDIIFYTDTFLKHNYASNYRGKKNIAWILEPKSIDNTTYEKVINNLNLYDYVISHDKFFIDYVNYINPKKGLLCDVGGSWIEEKDWKIYQKKKNISIIASNKRITYGHKLRHDIILNYGNIIDSILGRGYNPIDYKLKGLSDYRFSVAIENETDTFTEKLIDCLITGTIPIYYGPSNIDKIFNIDGFLIINKVEDFKNILKNINEKYYDSKIKAIEENFNLCLKYTNTEDLIYHRYYDIIFAK
jgi:hypothetical protein